ncbi:MAG: hypothetical protein C4535_14560 [Comamonadaceae bacterium]|nr:MAG: hypothetical protein C4535_14560 [Comamonadaceae bacterium]
MALLAIPVAATLLIVLWVGSMNLLQGPGTTLTMLGVGTILLTGAIASWEASRVGMATERKRGTYGPLAWFFLHSFLWVVGYPAYLLKRRHYGLKNLLVPGLLVGALFIGAWSLMAADINERVDKVKDAFTDVEKDFNELGKALSDAGKEFESLGKEPIPAQLTAPVTPSEKVFNLAAAQSDYRALCKDKRVYGGMTHGGETEAEAKKEADAVCVDVPAAFVACVKEPSANAADCFVSTSDSQD